MNLLRFIWDERKNAANKVKHSITFEEAKTVFYDENALLISDPEHSENEDRFLLLGFSSAAKMLIVSHCYREDDRTIRIISAMKADKREQQQYQERL
jgi:uncharacterized DUF497 family protein